MKSEFSNLQIISSNFLASLGKLLPLTFEPAWFLTDFRSCATFKTLEFHWHCRKIKQATNSLRLDTSLKLRYLVGLDTNISHHFPTLESRFQILLSISEFYFPKWSAVSYLSEAGGGIQNVFMVSRPTHSSLNFHMENW